MRDSDEKIKADLRQEIKDLKKQHLKDLSAKKLLTVQKKHTVYVDGVIAYPFILKYCKEHKVRPYAFGFLILMCTLKEVRLGMLMKYGFPKCVTHQALTYLVENGWAEKFGTGLYTPSLKGRKLFFNYKIYYCESVTKQIYNESKQTKYHRWPK